jgi:hypothetical protein
VRLPLAAVCAAALAVAASAPSAAAPARLAATQIRCGDATIRSPQQGDTLLGSIPISGSARIDDFNFYKLEYAHASNPDAWSAVSSTKPDPVVGGMLDVWNTQTVPDGPYYLKLTVVDPIGQEVCRFTVADLYVANMGTPTPSATPTPEESPTATATLPATQAAEAPPLDEPTIAPTIEPIVPTESGGGFLSPSGLAGAMGLESLIGNFLKGFIAVMSVATIVAFLAWLRSG